MSNVSHTREFEVLQVACQAEATEINLMTAYDALLVQSFHQFPPCS